MKLKRGLLLSQNLETLHLTGGTSGLERRRTWIPDRLVLAGERLPAIKELVLHNYDWRHSSDNAVKFWDFIRVTHLELKGVSMHRFLSTIPPQHLLQVKTLILEDLCDTYTVGVTSKMRDLMSKIHALETLLMKYIVRKTLPSVLKHGATLRSLELRDYNGRNNDDCWSTFAVANIKTILRNFPGLMEFSFDAWLEDDKVSSNLYFLAGDVLPKMRNLRRLTIYTRTTQAKVPTLENKTSYSYTDEAVRMWLFKFSLVKKGQSSRKSLST